MLKLTLDTNILVSSAIAEGPSYHLLKLADQGKVRIIISSEILREFISVISRKKFGFPQKNIDRAVHRLVHIADILISPIPLEIVSADPDDDKVVSCAITSKCDYIVSGVHHLLDLKVCKGIPVTSPAEALRIIDFS